MACQVQFVRVDTTYSIIMSSAKRIYYATTMWKEDTTYTLPSIKLCPKQKSMAPCAILCTVQFVLPLLLTFVLYGLKNCMFCCFSLSSNLEVEGNRTELPTNQQPTSKSLTRVRSQFELSCYHLGRALLGDIFASFVWKKFGSISMHKI
jgi:hypothetical protein